LRLAHRTIVLTLLTLGVAWGACLILAGLFLFGMGFESVEPRKPLILVGLAGVAAGNFVFMDVVADRLFSPVRRKPMDIAEILAAAAMVIALVSAAGVSLTETLP
jgi:hypothetical protein